MKNGGKPPQSRMTARVHFDFLGSSTISVEYGEMSEAAALVFQSQRD
jgi:hypothetical protein